MSPNPTRWLDDPSFAVDAKALLRSAAPGPTPGALAAVWDRIEAQTAAVPPATSAHPGAWSLAKVATLVVVGVLSTQLSGVIRGGRPIGPSSTLPSRGARVTVPIPPPVQPPPIVTPLASAPSGPVAVPSIGHPTPSTVTAPRRALVRSGSSFEDEMALLGPARTLTATNPARALELANLHAQRFPQGALQHEREAVAIAALVHLHRAHDAVTRADRFLTAHPDSTSAPRIRALREEAQAPSAP